MTETVLPGSSLNAARRLRELDEIDSGLQVDLLVIGGGITGVGVALDAATRGLSVVLAEKHDLAFGTSRWSSKLVHGGLRYLSSGRVGIAYESAVERGIAIARTAPHLVRAMPQVVPLHPEIGTANAAAVRLGFVAGDVLRRAARTSRATLPRSGRIDAGQVRRFAPTVRAEGLRGGIVGWDGQLTDDARLVVGVARTAAAHGARIITRCAVEQATGSGAVLLDTLSGRRFEVAARMVINAAGVWAGELADGITLRPSRGTHLVMSQESFGGLDAGLSAGLTVPVPGSFGRFVFALPAPDRRVYVGLTDEDAPGPIPDEPTASDAEIDFLLDTVNLALETPLTRTDILGTYSGLRPLLDSGEGATADISRKHQLITAADGLVTVVGGKLTTYRRMAEDAVDAALADRRVGAAPCRTRDVPIVGAASRSTLAALDVPTRLLRRYGTDATTVLREADGDARLLDPLHDGTQTTAAEFRFAVRHEGALDEADLLDRRTRIGVVPAARARAEAAATAALASG
jgi:glycerol-3-phosphate dehydrogenase